MGIFSFLGKSKIASEEAILNYGLKCLLNSSLSLISSIYWKLAERFPDLSEEIINDYELKCRAAQHYGYALIYDTMVERVKKSDFITKKELKDLYRNGMKFKYSWVNKRNLRTIEQSAYYGLFHDGWDEFKK